MGSPNLILIILKGVFLGLCNLPGHSASLFLLAVGLNGVYYFLELNNN